MDEAVRNGKVTTSKAALDDISRSAALGGAVVKFEVTGVTPEGTNRAVIALERSNAGAKEAAARYRSVYKALGGSAQDRLVVTNNAVVAYGARPSPKESAVVERCVRPPR